MGRELAWQREVKGDAAKVTAFKAQVVGLQTFRAFAFMKPKSPLMHFAHSVGQYYGFSGLSPELQDRHIAFVGDRTADGGAPMPVVLPVKKAWDWARVTACMDVGAFITHYNGEGTGNKLWGTPGGQQREILLPRMLAMPNVMMAVLVQQGPCLPHQMRQAVKDYMDGGGTQLDQSDWQLVL